MEFHSFEQLKRMEDGRSVMGAVRLILSVMAAIAILGGLVMLLPLGA